MRCPRCFRKLAAGAVCPTDGSAAAGESPVAAIDAGGPPVVPGWSVDGLIGAGGQAAVWRGRRDGDGQVAAIKIAHGASGATAARFAEEAAVLAAIGAPAVAAVFGHGVLADRRPFVAMELLDGATLGDRLAATMTQLALDEVLDWLRGIAHGLEALHGAGFVHRDLKPENVVRDRAGAVRLLDLGLARRATAPGATVGVVAGTPLYMAPEQLRGGAIDARADLYALGALGFEAATMRPPFVGDRAAIELGHLAFRPPRASAVRAVPAALDALLAACLAKDPEERPASARGFLDALGALDPTALVTTAAPVAVANRSSVALVAVERAPATLNLAVEAGRRGGQVARQTPGRAILGFAPDDCAAPLPAALATAQALHAAGARVAIHVAQVTARRGKDGRTMLFGAAVDKPAEWLPGATASGVLLTDAAARELTGAELEAIDGGCVRLRARDAGGHPAPAPSTGPLLGRDALLASARGSAAAALASGPPSTWVALGGDGSGKSRLADELAAIAGRDGEVAVVRLHGQRSFGAGAAVATRGLFDGLAAFAAPPPVDAPVPLTAQVRAALDAVLAVRPLAIVIDDAQWIDDALLAALGVAVRASTAPLWLAATGSEAIAAARPPWLDGARVSVETLAPLDDADTRVLLRRALAPARRVPDALLARLAARCGGVPGVVAALVRELRRAGVIRRHSGSDVWFVAADELDFLPPTPGVQWFVARQLADLGPGLAELARACALLGAGFRAGEIDAATATAEAGVAVDPRIGVAALVAAGVLVDERGVFRFRSEAEQDAIADAVPPKPRQAVHRAVLAYLLAGSESDPDPGSDSESDPDPDPDPDPIPIPDPDPIPIPIPIPIPDPDPDPIPIPIPIGSRGSRSTPAGPVTGRARSRPPSGSPPGPGPATRRSRRCAG